MLFKFLKIFHAALKTNRRLYGKCFFSSKFQCGFRKSYSTQQRLIELIEEWKSATDKGKYFGALLIDLSKPLLNLMLIVSVELR